MKLRLLCLFISCLGLYLPTQAIESAFVNYPVKKESRLDFTVDESSLRGGAIHLAQNMLTSITLKSDYPLFDQLDFSEIFKLGGKAKFFAAKYAYMISLPITKISKEKLLSKEGFLLLSKKSTITSVQTLDEKSLKIKFNKDFKVYTVAGTTDFSYLSAEESKDLPYASALEQAAHPYPIQFVTIQHSYDFSKILEKAYHICLYSDVESTQTLVQCYSLSAMDVGWYKKTKLLVDAEAAFEREMIQFAQNMKNAQF